MEVVDMGQTHAAYGIVEHRLSPWILSHGPGVAVQAADGLSQVNERNR